MFRYPEDTFVGACERFRYHTLILLAPIRNVLEGVVAWLTYLLQRLIP